MTDTTTERQEAARRYAEQFNEAARIACTTSAACPPGATRTAASLFAAPARASGWPVTALNYPAEAAGVNDAAAVRAHRLIERRLVIPDTQLDLAAKLGPHRVIGDAPLREQLVEGHACSRLHSRFSKPRAIRFCRRCRDFTPGLSLYRH